MNRINQEKNDIFAAIKQIDQTGTDEIIEIAVTNSISGYNSIVFYDPQENNFSGKTWTSGTYLNPESRLIEVYRLQSNWISNNTWRVNDILSDEEYKILYAAVKKNTGIQDESDLEYTVDFLDPDQLSLININLNERLSEYLIWCEVQMHQDDTIIERLKRNLERLFAESHEEYLLESHKGSE